jgi:tRNA A37 threonylcarbamoyladenosine dehydratase
MENEIYERSRALLGTDAFNMLSKKHVVVLGNGGVGGWCAEALLRTGVRHLTLIDDDYVAWSNINRQRQALPSTVNKLKVEVLRDIFLEIAPHATINAIPERYTPENAEKFADIMDNCDFIIDAIDSVDCKAYLIQRYTSKEGIKPVIFSSMGAALRVDPTKIRITPFHKVTGDGLAKALRNKFRKAGTTLPKHLCVYSEELPKDGLTSIKGSIMPVTCAFGMTLASLVLQNVMTSTN